MTIVGKSGSGKTTLANIISFLDFEYEGSIHVDGRKMTSLSKDEKNNFRNSNIGVVFQNYHLLENECVIYNIALPLLIDGNKKEEAYKRASELLTHISFPEYLYDEKVKNLSGGEKQRVAILRSIIRNPKIIIADEPTGALDLINSKLILNLLKRISNKRLVIVISHDLNLVKKYSDRIIELKDGRVIKDEQKSVQDLKLKFVTSCKKKSKSDLWTWHLTKNELKESKTKTSIFFAVFSICFILTNLMICLMNGIDDVKTNEPRKVLNYNNFKISQKITVPIEGTSFSLIKTSRLENNQLEKYVMEYPSLLFKPTLDALFVTGDFLFLENQKISVKPLLSPVYAFNKNYLNNDLFSYRSKEQFPSGIIINDILFKMLNNIVGGNVLNKEYELKFTRDIVYYADGDLETEIIDKFIFSQKFKILGVVEEFSFLSEPQIYYSYEKMEKDLSEYNLVNISNYLNRQINVIEYINECSPNDELTSYSHLAFFNDGQDFIGLETTVGKLKNDVLVEIYSPALNKKEAFIGILEAAMNAVDILLAFVLTGSLIIIGIITYSSYVLNQKNIAILLSLGATKYHILKIFISMNFALVVVSFFIVKVIDAILVKSINHIIENLTGIRGGLLTISQNQNVNNLVVFLIGVFLILLVNAIPLFIKKISIIKELKNDD